MFHTKLSINFLKFRVDMRMCISEDLRTFTIIFTKDSQSLWPKISFARFTRHYITQRLYPRNINSTIVGKLVSYELTKNLRNYIIVITALGARDKKINTQTPYSKVLSGATVIRSL